MTKTSRSHLFAKALLAASALTVPAVDTKLSSVKQSTNYIKVADHKGHKSHRGHRSDGHRGNRSRSHRGNRSRGHDSHRGHNRRADRGHRSDRRRNNFRSDRRFRSNRGFSSRNRGYRFNRGYNRHVNYNRGYTPYRSNVGISFNFGSPRYSGYRWAPTAYSFYQPSYGAYSAYQTSTVCRRITTEAYHHGHVELISVKQCSNPWDGTYIVQGSERVIDCRW